MAFLAQSLRVAKLLPKSMRVLSQAGTRQNMLPFHLPVVEVRQPSSVAAA